ncbi:MAG TPA: hypothetical protein VGT99_05820 [Gammaproteobacteria bacterium]|nr:hypothetical protein [Gammaproteobacteria bacterium]
MHSAIQMKGSLLVLALSLAVIGLARADTAPPLYPAMAPIEQYLSASPAVEIAMAKSAGPKSVTDNATVMVLTKTGYETAVKGSNGFVCFIQRSWAKDFGDPEFWDPHDYTPQCWNAAAVSSVLPEYLKRTQWVLAGVSKEEMAARTKAAWASHEFVPPAPESVAFMMSKDQYINDPQPGAPSNWYPHIMFFVPATEDSKWGANLRGSPVFSTTSAVDPITTFFIVAPKWSDGSLGPYVAAPAATTGKPETHHHG